MTFLSMSNKSVNTPLYAPRETFEQILQFAVIPTFDLILEFPEQGVILLRRRIAPYQDTWALPGLRIMKPEGIDDVLRRIARQELGVVIAPSGRRFIGQYVARFKTEFERQDLSTCYALPCEGQAVRINPDHFTRYRFVRSIEEIPANTGAMYRFFLTSYFQDGSNVTSTSGKPS